MKRLTTITALAISLTLSSCEQKDTPNDNENPSNASQNDGVKQEEIANKIMDSLQEFAKAVTAVSDTETAQSTATKITEIGDQFAAMADELKPLEIAPLELRKSIDQKMTAREAEMEKVMKEKFMTAVQSLNPEAQKIMEQSFKEFFGKMQEAGKEFDRHFKVESQENN